MMIGGIQKWIRILRRLLGVVPKFLYTQRESFHFSDQLPQGRKLSATIGKGDQGTEESDGTSFSVCPAVSQKNPSSPFRKPQLFLCSKKVSNQLLWRRKIRTEAEEFKVQSWMELTRNPPAAGFGLLQLQPGCCHQLRPYPTPLIFCLTRGFPRQAVHLSF